MFLQRLSEYADRLPDLPPPMYQRVPVRYVIPLDGEGRPGQHIDRGATEANKRSVSMFAPYRKRTSAPLPRLLADDAEYTFGRSLKDDPKRAQLRHAAYVELVGECARKTGEQAVAVVQRFLTALDKGQLDMGRLGLPDDFDRSATITFMVDGVYPVDLPTVRSFWAAEASAADESAPIMQCLVCGELRPCAERLAVPVKGIACAPQGEMVLISANKPAFLSYGLNASLIAPTCESCGLRFGNALNTLLRQRDTHLNVGCVSYIFWSREDAPFALASLLSDARPDEVRQFLTAVWRGKPGAADLDTTPFYAATLSASVSRVVVRDWIETTLGEAQRHLARYFALQRLVDARGEERWFPLERLAKATVNSKSRNEKPAPQVGQALLHMALHGGPLPEWLLYQAVRRARAEQGVKSAHAALIKMVLLSQDDAMKRSNDMAELDVTNRDPAYLCGRLLAELDVIQRTALGKTNTTVVDRYFGTASSAPASVYGRLVRGAQPHLAKLRHERPGAYRRLDERLAEIMEGLPTFPRTLTLVDQGRFALGFYHQKAANIRAAQAYRHAKGLAGQAGAPQDEGDVIEDE
jgi:CRISPR-associated protein Csd1